MSRTESPLNRSELASKYGNGQFIRTLLDHLSTVSLLRSCILRRNYSIPDLLNNSIHLTPAGTHVRDELVKRETVPPKEAKLLTYLGMLHVEPLVDFEKTDLSSIHKAISQAIKKKDFLYPFIFGKDLYDRAASLFPEEREYLRHEDTLTLIESGLFGVFHSRHLLVGPYGLIETKFERMLDPTTNVRLQHCADPSCGRVHRVQLTTSIDAPINRHRPALNKVLDKLGRDSSDWNGYLLDALRDDIEDFSDTGYATAPYLIGDAFADVELVRLFEYALRNTDGRLRKVCEDFDLRGSEKQISKDMTRDKIMQLLLTESDDSLVLLLDHAIAGGEIDIPAGEIRQPRVNHASRSTAWHLRPQISRLGYRSVAGVTEHPNLRLAAIVHDLYDLESPAEIEELQWLLREARGEGVTLRLELLLRSLEPPDLVRRLVFARRANMEKVCSHLGVTMNQGDDDIVEQVLWKLGFSEPSDTNFHAEYWQAHANAAKVARLSTGGLESVESSLRAAGASYGVALEKYLYETVVYVTWALLEDHYSSRQPFVYRRSEAETFARERIALAAQRESYSGFSVDDKLTISSLTNWFGLLARELDAVVSASEKAQRPSEKVPRFARKTAMQEFPFRHTVPFLDLDLSSRADISALLMETTSRIAASRIAETRNSLLHANRNPLQPSVFADALDEMSTALSRLEASGLVPKVYRFARFEAEKWGRGVTILLTKDCDEYRLHSPSRFEWLNMPNPMSNQLVFRCATFADSGQALRFRQGFDSSYEEYWADYPKRREPGNAIGADKSDSLSSPVQTGSHISSRAD